VGSEMCIRDRVDVVKFAGNAFLLQDFTHLGSFVECVDGQSNKSVVCHK